MIAPDLIGLSGAALRMKLEEIARSPLSEAEASALVRERKRIEESEATPGEWVYPPMKCPECKFEMKPRLTQDAVRYDCTGIIDCPRCNQETDCENSIVLPVCFGRYAPGCSNRFSDIGGLCKDQALCREHPAVQEAGAWPHDRLR